MRRPARRRLHVRQRAPRPPLRYSGRLRVTVPPRLAAGPRAARRPARPRRPAGPDLVSDPHVAGAARQVAARHDSRRAAPVAAGRRAGVAGAGAREAAPPRCASGWSATGRPRPAPPATRPSIRPGFALEQFDGLGAWRTADEFGNPDRCHRDHAGRSRPSRRHGRPARAAPGAAGAVRRHGDRKAPLLLPRARPGARRQADRARRRAQTPRPTTTVGRRSSRAS